MMVFAKYFGFYPLAVYLWLDALAYLHIKLPSEVMLKCCVTCKHGNLCPVGNCENEVFCMKDIEPKQKSDLLFYTEDEDERKKRSKSYFFKAKILRRRSKSITPTTIISIF